MKREILLGFAVLLCMIPAVDAAPATAGGSGTGTGGHCFYADVAGVTAFTGAGQTGMCVHFPTDVNSNTATVMAGGNAMAPPVTAGTTTFTWTLSDVSGCTASALTSNTVSTAATAVSNTYFTLTMTSDACRAVLQVNIVTGTVPTTVANHRQAINIQVPFTNVDETARLCDASARGTPCDPNPITATLNLWAPILALILIMIWAECTRDMYLYIFAVVCTAVVVPLLWAEMGGIRILFILAALMMCARAYDAYLHAEEENEAKEN